MFGTRDPYAAGPRGPLAGRRRERGGLSSAFLTLSVLLLVMALGFVFGRVVIARAYIKAAPVLSKEADATQPETAPAANSPEVVYGEPTARTPNTGERLNPEDVPTGDGGTDSASPSSSDSSTTPSTAPEAGDVRYAVQAGVFSSEQSARQVADQLTRAGYPATIDVNREDSPASYKVVVGRYRSEANARKALDQIKHEGYAEAFVVTR